MNQYQEWSVAFAIMAKYEDKYGNISAEHDVVYAGPSPEIVTQEDIDALEELGWHISDFDCFYSFV